MDSGEKHEYTRLEIKEFLVTEMLIATGSQYQHSCRFPGPQFPKSDSKGISWWLYMTDSLYLRRLCALQTSFER